MAHRFARLWRMELLANRYMETNLKSEDFDNLETSKFRKQRSRSVGKDFSR